MEKDLVSLFNAATSDGTVSATGDQPDYTTGTPWLDCDLVGNVTESTRVSLKDHFALAVNKDRILKIEIPEGYPYGGTMMDLTLKNVEDTKKMFLGKIPAEHDAKLAYDLFWLMMDWEGRNALGIAPLKQAADKIEAIDNVNALTAYILETPPEEQLTTLWEVGPVSDLKDSTHYILAFAWNENQFLLKDSAEYSKLTDYGRVMTGEGCADMGGMKVVLRIAAEKEGFDYDTLFRTLCLVWMEKGSLQAAYYQINDEHPMGYLRVNCTLQQFDEFINFYGIKEGDGMFLAPEDRVAIW